MPDNDHTRTTDWAAGLRYRAEAEVNQESLLSDDLSKMSFDEMRSLIHELRIQKTELELQNQVLREAQLELSKSRDEYADLYNRAPVGFLAVSGEGMILQANLAAAKMLGIDSEMLSNQPLSSFVVPEDQDKYYLNKAIPGVCNVRLTTSNATSFDAELNVTPIIDPDGDFKQFRLTISDVTDRRRADRALAESEQRYRLMMEITNEGVWALGADLRTTYVNKKMALMLGYSVDEIIGEPAESFMFEEDIHSHEQNMELRLQGGNQFYERRFKKKDGSVLWTTVSATGTHDHDRAFCGTFGMFTDITERKVAEEELRIRDAAVDKAMSAIVFAFRDGTISHCNQSFVKMWGFDDSRTPIGMHVSSLHYDQEDFSRAYTAFEQNGQYRGVLGARKVDGTKFFVEMTANRINDEDGNTLLFMGSFLDVTVKIQAEEQLRISEANLRSLIDAIGEPVFLIDTAGVLITANRSLSQNLAPGKSDMVGKCVYEFLPSDVAERRRNWVDEVFQSGLPLETKDQRDGRDFRHSFYPVFNAQGMVDRVAVYSKEITEWLQMARAIREGEERYRQFIETANEGIWFLDKDFKITFVNNRWTDMMGYTLDEILGKHADSYVLEEDLQSHREALELRRQGVSQTYERRFRKKDGSCIWTILSETPIMDEQGKIGGSFVMLTDITDRKRSEETLRKSEQSLRLALEAARAGTWEWDVPRKAGQWSGELWELAGLDSKEFRSSSETWLMAVHPDDRTTIKETVLEAVAKKQEISFECRILRPSGEIRWLMARGAPLFDEYDNVTGYLGIGLDITEQRQVIESRELLAGVVEHASESIIITDTDGIITYVNKSFENITGYSSNEAIGQNPRFLKSGEHLQTFYQDMWNTISVGNVWHGVITNRKKDGSLISEDSTIFPMKNTSDNSINYVAMKRDITGELNLQRQLAQSQKMEAVGTLAGGIAHDFNNVLFAITGYAELALGSTSPGSSINRQLGQILSAAGRAAELVKHILTFSREIKKEKKPLLIGPILKESLNFLRASITTNIEIKRNISGNLRPVLADPTEIHQIIMNLATNAYHAMKTTGGSLLVSLDEVELSSDFVKSRPEMAVGLYQRLKVADTGHGMSAETLRKIFNPYFTTKKPGQGTGLGLSVVDGIVRSNGGAITVDSLPGRGTTFEIYFPVTFQKPAMDVETEHAFTQGKGNILFVDDERMVTDVTKLNLEKLGYNVLTENDPVKALEIFELQPDSFDLVITDMSMPKMTGLELSMKILETRKDIPIILITGFSDLLEGKDFSDYGILDSLQKPLKTPQLAQAIFRVLAGQKS